MNKHQHIIELWPKRALCAKDVGVTEGVVNAWHRRDSIPPEYWHAFVRSAALMGHAEVTVDLLASMRAVAKQQRAADRVSA